MARKEARPIPETSTTVDRARREKMKQRWLIVASGVVVLAVCVLAKSYLVTDAAQAQTFGSRASQPADNSKPQTVAAPQAANKGGAKDADALPKVDAPKHDVMAIVNGADIRREALAAACVDRYGKDTLESLVNKRLIEHHCRNRGVTVTDQDIDAEIDRMAARFKIPRQQWLEMLEKERGINEQEYKRDILWPTLALRKLANDQLTVSDQQLHDAYETQFGESIKARLIVVGSREAGEQLHQQLIDHPDEFARLAMQNSQDVNSASIGGLIQPIRHHVGDPAIEKEVFALAPNQISPIIPVGNQFAILKCEAHIPPRNVPLESVRDELVDRIKEDKLRGVAADLFKKLQDSATIQNIWNDPALRQQMPGIVATVNGEQIEYKELADECMLRHGKEVLEVEISHLLLQQALAKTKETVTKDDLDAEIAHAAQLAGVVDGQGKPDFDKWFKMATEEQGITQEQYMRDSVWPSAALKKLTHGSIQVTDDDLQKGYSANYGERIRCRAIVLGNMRRAQEVWAKARQNPSMDFFGDLAEQYSIEPQSKALRGEVPPIRKYGGQPQLEDVAFELAKDELSGIIQMGDKFVILKCEGHTDPVDVKPQDVHEVLYQDILEKKMRVAMSDKFAAIRSQARIDNYLANTSQSPDRLKPDAPGEVTTRHLDSAVRPTAGAESR
ncbi:MAG TPA: peptidylprolyl isomerase [Lacipirellulaceae bacterium]|jgi:parvulin-like peptidyl-prolyl isomerase